MIQSERKRLLHRLTLLALTPIFFFFAASGPGSPDPKPTTPDRRIDIIASPSHPALWGSNFGALKLRTVLILTSSDEDFGGWSGLSVDPNGALLALSDRASLLRGKLDMDAHGAPIGVTDSFIGVLRDEGGDSAPRLSSDAEGLARLPGGRYVVSFENPARIGLYDFAAEGSRAPLRLGPPLAKITKLGLHHQLESVAALADGSILVGSERGFNRDDHAVLWRVLSTETSITGAIEPWTKLKLPKNLSLTDLAAAPDGSVFVLFRQFMPYVSARAQIWRYAFIEKDGQAHAEGQMLASFEAPFPIDNYEGLAVTPKPEGGLRLYVISDDNFRKRQRTILAVFDLDETPRSNEKAPETGASSNSK